MAKQDQKEESQAKRRLEAAAACLGAALALATLAIVVWDGLTGGDTPPMVTVEALAIHAHDDGYVLEILALNKGGETAAQVVVEGELRRAGESVATSQTTFDYVPRQSQRRGGLFFSENPQDYDVSVRALGYIQP